MYLANTNGFTQPTLPSPPSSVHLPLSTASPLRDQFTGARALARLNVYQRLLESSQETDFGLPEAAANNFTDATNSSQPTPRGNPLGLLVGRFIQSVHTLFQAQESRTARHGNNESHTNASEINQMFESAQRTFYSVRPFTLSDVLKQFGGCQQSFSDLVTVMVERKGIPPGTAKQLFIAALHLDDRFRINPNKERRTQVCELLIKMGRDLDNPKQQDIVNAILHLSRADNDDAVMDKGDSHPTGNGTITAVEERGNQTHKASPMAVRFAAAGSATVGGSTALASVYVLKPIRAPGVIDLAEAGISLGPKAPSIVPVVVMGAGASSGAATSGASLAIDPSGLLTAVPRDTFNAATPDNTDDRSHIGDIGSFSEASDTDDTENTDDASGTKYVSNADSENDPSIEVRGDRRNHRSDRPGRYDYLHWKSQDGDLDRISINDSEDGEPLFFEWHDTTAEPPALDISDALISQLLRSAQPNAAAEPMFRWIEGATPAPSLLPEDTISIDGSVLVPQRDGGGQLHWCPLPLVLYEGPPAPATDTGQWVEFDGIKHIRIDDRLYPLRETLPGQLWIYSPRNAKLPMLPLVLEGETWRIQSAPDIAPAEPPLSPNERAVRYDDGEKFVRSGTGRLPVDRVPIIGEDDVEHLAVPLGKIGTLAGPDEEGFLEGPDYRLWIEGEQGFYPVETFDLATREVKITGMDSTGTQVLRYHHALQNWHLVEKAIFAHAVTRSLSFDNLDHYRAQLRNIPFLHDRHKLKYALSSLLGTLRELRIVSFNQPWAGPVTPELREHLYEARAAVSEQLYDIKGWDALSALQKQYADAKAQALMLRTFKDDLGVPPVGLCGEHAGLAFHSMPTHMKRDGSMTRMTFREFPGTGRNHEALLIAKSADLIQPFLGDITKRGVDALRGLIVRSRAEFAQYLYEHRDDLMIVDTWGSQRLIAFDTADSPEDALMQIYRNLREAGFGRGHSADFSVSASVPKRSALKY